MRISEAAHWQISDIDSARMQIRIARGKGAKERRVPLSPRLLEERSELALANRMEMADLLFTAAWKSLRKTTREQQDYDPASMMVLHTWNQRLEPHWHVHALVPGGGPSS